MDDELLPISNISKIKQDFTKMPNSQELLIRSVSTEFVAPIIVKNEIENENHYQYDQVMDSKNFVHCLSCSQMFEVIEDLAEHYTSVKQCHTLENQKFLTENMKNFKGKNLRDTDSDMAMIQKGLVFCISCCDHFALLEELFEHCNINEKCQTKENEQYLKKYIRDQTNYNCAFCVKTFLWESTLIKHVSKDHDRKKLKPKSKFEKEKSVKSKIEESTGYEQKRGPSSFTNLPHF